MYLTAFHFIFDYLMIHNERCIKKFGILSRLTPMYMLVLGTYVTLFAYWGDGPQWPYEKGLDPNCNQYWWTNLLYINNFVSQGKQVFTTTL